MKYLSQCASALLLGLVCVEAVGAWTYFPFALHRTGKHLHGKIIDFTHNHGHDHRIWSAALCEKRDLYVYLPPGYDPCKRYPLGIFLHGANQDEMFFLQTVKLFDKAIADGKLPPVILAAPDGSIQGRFSLYNSASFYANTRAGRFEDFIMCDVWDFLMTHFPIRPERQAHSIFGVSMGGAGSFALAMRHRDRVGTAIGFMPALNLRWVDCHGKYYSPFDPNCWGWREKWHSLEVIGRPKGILNIRFGQLFTPIIGNGPGAVDELSRINPAEIMEHTNLQPGELEMFIAYGGKDEFNIAAQVDSFLCLAHQRGIHVTTTFDPEGRHDYESGARALPTALEWVAPLVLPYSPN